jgi:hypothetical protein
MEADQLRERTARYVIVRLAQIAPTALLVWQARLHH